MKQPISTRVTHKYLGSLSPHSGHEQLIPTPHLAMPTSYLETSRDTRFPYRTKPHGTKTDAHFGGAAAAVEDISSVLEVFSLKLGHRPVRMHSLTTELPQDLGFEPHATVATSTEPESTEIGSIPASHHNPTNRFRTRTAASHVPNRGLDSSIVVSISSGATETSAPQQVKTNHQSSIRSLLSTFT